MSRSVDDCAPVQAAAAELALGIVSGSERAGALAHLTECPECRHLVDDLSQVADGLLLLTPAVEPRVGFEARVLTEVPPPPVERLPALPRRLRGVRQSRVAPLVAATAVAVLMAAAGAAAGVAFSGGGSTMRTAVSVSANGQATCRAFAHGQRDAWLFVDLEAPPAWEGDYVVEALVEGSSYRSVGTLRLQGGQGTMATRLDVPARKLEAIRMLDARGTPRYETRFG